MRLYAQQLADRFGTSRGPVNAALQELERLGLVQSIDRRGTFVRSVSDEDIEEIFSLWDLLWSFALRRAAQRIGDDERKWLEHFRDRKVPDEPGALMEHGIEFSRHVFRMAHHTRATEIFEALLIQAQARSLFLIATGKPDGISWNRDYAPLCDALARGDGEEAVAIAERRLSSARDFWFNQLRSQDG